MKLLRLDVKQHSTNQSYYFIILYTFIYNKCSAPYRHQKRQDEDAFIYCISFQLCIPRYSTVEHGNFTEEDVKDHIIITGDTESYTTWSGKVRFGSTFCILLVQAILLKFIYNTHTLPENIKFNCTSFRNY